MEPVQLVLSLSAQERKIPWRWNFLLDHQLGTRFPVCTPSGRVSDAIWEFQENGASTILPLKLILVSLTSALLSYRVERKVSAVNLPSRFSLATLIVNDRNRS